jgi:NAD(P)-dependent dehydrogenase (short-subunit alcohol dehydrogenase family)
MARIGTPGEVSGLAAFLCLPPASYITGQVRTDSLVATYPTAGRRHLGERGCISSPLERDQVVHPGAPPYGLPACRGHDLSV